MVHPIFMVERHGRCRQTPSKHLLPYPTVRSPEMASKKLCEKSICFSVTINLFINVTKYTLQFWHTRQHISLVRRRHSVVAVKSVAHGCCEYFRTDRADSSHSILVQKNVTSNGDFNFGPLDQIQGRIEGLEFFEFFQIFSLHARLECLDNGVGKFLHTQSSVHDNSNRSRIRRITKGFLNGSRVSFFDGGHGEWIEVCAEGIDLDKAVLDTDATTSEIVAITEGREQNARGLFFDGLSGTNDITTERHRGCHVGSLRGRR
mmetsp:Transcript_12469/g.23894  ORF Transcript_12469/g.23894 Transcript_12469/m.23894 type:complete len:261 (-) Transcript_12469:271-1053(-)